MLNREQRLAARKPTGLAPIRQRLARMAKSAKRPQPLANPQLSRPLTHNQAGAKSRDDVNMAPTGTGIAMQGVPIMKRVVTLTSDAIVLTLASPFFAVWWLSRCARRFFNGQ